jgi:hypothetical protein
MNAVRREGVGRFSGFCKPPCYEQIGVGGKGVKSYRRSFLLSNPLEKPLKDAYRETSLQENLHASYLYDFK